MIDYIYKFPKHENNKDILGEQNSYNVFIEAYGFTYLGTYEEFAKGFPFDNEISMKIPMGYKAILAYERLNIVACGNIVWENMDRKAWTRKTLDGRKINYFDNSVTPVIDRYLENVYCIFDQQGKISCLQSFSVATMALILLTIVRICEKIRNFRIFY